MPSRKSSSTPRCFLPRSTPTRTALDRPTARAGPVQDQVSHVVGLEQLLSGAVHPPIELPLLDHVVSELDAYMERPIQARRALPFIAVIDELNGMLPRRISQYRELIDQGDPETASPLGGTRPLSKALPAPGVRPLGARAGHPAGARCRAAPHGRLVCLGPEPHSRRVAGTVPQSGRRRRTSAALGEWCPARPGRDDLR